MDPDPPPDDGGRFALGAPPEFSVWSLEEPYSGAATPPDIPKGWKQEPKLPGAKAPWLLIPLEASPHSRAARPPLTARPPPAMLKM